MQKPHKTVPSTTRSFLTVDYVNYTVRWCKRSVIVRILLRNTCQLQYVEGSGTAIRFVALHSWDVGCNQKS